MPLVRRINAFLKDIAPHCGKCGDTGWIKSTDERGQLSMESCGHVFDAGG
jgi:hypothetical protein